MIRHHRKHTSSELLFLTRGFALPTILISSIVMIIVLLVSVSSTTAVRTAMKNQYYTQLAQAAGEAGVAYAEACLNANAGIPQWSDAAPLKSNTNCSGVETVSCPTTSVAALCSVTRNSNVRSNFSIGLPPTDTDGRAKTIPNTGYVEVLRTSNKAVWRKYEQKSVPTSAVPDLCSGSAKTVLGWSNVVSAGFNYPFPEPLAQGISNSTTTSNVGAMYFRKDFSVAKAGTYTLTQTSDNQGEVYLDGNLVSSSAYPTVATANVTIDVGCHSVQVKLVNTGILANSSGLKFSLEQVGASSPLVVSDKTWRVSKGEDRHYSEVNYYADPAAWTPVRDLQPATTTAAAWGTSSGDVDSRWINTTHSYDGSGNYPSNQFTLFRDNRDIYLTANTAIKITMLCDIACYPYVDGQLVNTGIGWPTISSFTVNLTAGFHKFAFLASNDGGISGFAFAAVASDGTVLSRSDGSWSAANFWSAANPTSTYSYDKTFDPSPDVTPVASCPCNQYQAAVIASGPLAYWPLNEVAGTTAVDISGGARNGTYNGLVTQNQSGAMSAASNRSVLLGGVGGMPKISLPVNAIWNRTTGQAFSVETWIKPSWTAGYRDIVVNRSNGATYNWILYQHAADGSLQLHGAAQNKSTYIPTNGVWSHVVATVDTSNTSRLYVNGTLVQTVAGFTFGSPGSVIFIGNGPSDIVEPYVGGMSDVALYTKALSQAEVSAHYAARLLP